jgi:hypothetical protein
LESSYGNKFIKFSWKLFGASRWKTKFFKILALIEKTESILQVLTKFVNYLAIAFKCIKLQTNLVKLTSLAQVVRVSENIFVISLLQGFCKFARNEIKSI